MSWDGKGSTTKWRRTRARILQRDEYLCQIRLDGCTGRATQVHHKQGRGVAEHDSALESACAHCNNVIGDPVKNADPKPKPTTRW